MAEKHDEATAKLMSYEELLAAKNDDLSKFKKELGQTKAALAERTSESETIAILRAQVCELLETGPFMEVKTVLFTVQYILHLFIITTGSEAKSMHFDEFGVWYRWKCIRVTSEQSVRQGRLWLPTGRN